MKTYIKRALTLVLVIALSALMFGCGTAKKTFTVYNASQLFLTAIEISNTDDVSSEESFVPIITAPNVVQAGQSGDYTIDIPADMLDDELYVYVAGARLDNFRPYDIIVPVGESLNDGVWGFSIDFDEENDTFVVTVLDSSSM